MADAFDINNLELDDNTFETVPDGDYHFTVESHEVDYSTSDKLPPNTQVIICHLDIPFTNKDGELKTASVRHNLPICKKFLWKVRQFAECIGMVPEKGKAKIDIDKIDGMTGICAITTGTSAKGNEYCNVQICYAPSKAPAVTANDDAWSKRGDFTTLDEEDPFDGI